MLNKFNIIIVINFEYVMYAWMRSKMLCMLANIMSTHYDLVGEYF